MQNNYILKNSNNEILYFYYGLEKSIYYTKYENGYLLDAVKIIEQVEDNFTVDFYKTGEIYLICQSLTGDIILCKEENGTFIKRNIFKLDILRRYKTFFQTLVNDTDMTLVYNLPIENSRNELLVKKHIGYEQRWSDALNIDSFTPFNLSLFKTQKIKDDHMIVLYQKRERENILGYRELTQNKVTSFNIFHKTPNQIIDQSFLATNNSIHFLYVIKNIFSSQIVYRYRDENGFSRPFILFEGNKIRSCSLGIIKGVLYAFWVIGSNLFFVTSNDGGRTFSNTPKNNRLISLNSRKIDFISFNKTQDNEFIFNELYVDTNDFTNIQFIKEEYPEFFKPKNNSYTNSEVDNSFRVNHNVLQDNFLSNFNQSLDSFFSQNKNISKNTSPQNLTQTNSKVTVFKPNLTLNDEFDQFANFDGFNDFKTDNKYNNQISILKSKINNIQAQLNEKSKEIIELNNIIQIQNDENTLQQNILEQKVESIKEENYKLKENFTFRENDGGEEIKDVTVEKEES